MRIKLNGQFQDVENARTLEDLVKIKGLVPARVIIEHNGRIVPCASWGKVGLTEADSVEVVSFVGGG